MNAIESIGTIGGALDRRVRCCICGFSEVRTDEVLDGDVVFLAECPRCDHRWTSREPITVDPGAMPAPTTARFQRVFARHARELQPAA